MCPKTFVETAALDLDFCFWCVSGCDHCSVLVTSWWPKFNQRLVWQQVRAAGQDKDAHCSTSLWCQWPRPHLEADHWSWSQWLCVCLAEKEDKTQSGGGEGQGVAERGSSQALCSDWSTAVDWRCSERGWTGKRTDGRTGHSSCHNNKVLCNCCY